MFLAVEIICNNSALVIISNFDLHTSIYTYANSRPLRLLLYPLKGMLLPVYKRDQPQFIHICNLQWMLAGGLNLFRPSQKVFAPILGAVAGLLLEVWCFVGS